VVTINRRSTLMATSSPSFGWALRSGRSRSVHHNSSAWSASTSHGRCCIGFRASSLDRSSSTATCWCVATGRCTSPCIWPAYLPRHSSSSSLPFLRRPWYHLVPCTMIRVVLYHDQSRVPGTMIRVVFGIHWLPKSWEWNSSKVKDSLFVLM
jgi:hypothetical protein